MKMIERVKDAIVKAATPTDKAKAAIAAMREPTKEMIKVAYDETSDGLDCRELWRRMIDAALKE